MPRRRRSRRSARWRSGPARGRRAMRRGRLRRAGDRSQAPTVPARGTPGQTVSGLALGCTAWRPAQRRRAVSSWQAPLAEAALSDLPGVLASDEGGEVTVALALPGGVDLGGHQVVVARAL